MLIFTPGDVLATVCWCLRLTSTTMVPSLNASYNAPSVSLLTTAPEIAQRTAPPTPTTMHTGPPELAKKCVPGPALPSFMPILSAGLALRTVLTLPTSSPIETPSSGSAWACAQGCSIRITLLEIAWKFVLWCLIYTDS